MVSGRKATEKRETPRKRQCPARPGAPVEDQTKGGESRKQDKRNPNSPEAEPGRRGSHPAPARRGLAGTGRTDRRPPPPRPRGAPSPAAPGTHQAEEVTVTIFQAGPVRHEGGTHRPSQQPPPAPRPTIRHYLRLRPERETPTPGRAGGCWPGGPWKRRPPGRPPSPPTPPPPRAAPAARPPAPSRPGPAPEAGGPCRARPAGPTAAAAEPADARPSLGDREDGCPFHQKNNKLHNK